jgi:hypothetical protein
MSIQSQKILQSYIKTLSSQKIHFGTTSSALHGLTDVKKDKLFFGGLTSYSQTFSTLEWRTDLQILIDEPILAQLSHTSLDAASIWIPCQAHAFTKDGRLNSTHWSQFISNIHGLSSSTRFNIVLSLDRTVTYSSEMLDAIVALREQLYPIDLIVEFEHRSWKNPTALKVYRGAKLCIAQRDLPTLTGFSFVLPNYNARRCYVRLLGRNKVNWFSPEFSQRHLYDYNRPELEQLAIEIRHLKEQYDEVHVIAVNHPATTAISNLYELAHLCLQKL